MAVWQQSPWYQQILQEVIEIAQQSGIAIAQQQAEQRGILYWNRNRIRIEIWRVRKRNIFRD